MRFRGVEDATVQFAPRESQRACTAAGTAIRVVFWRTSPPAANLDGDVPALRLCACGDRDSEDPRCRSCRPRSALTRGYGALHLGAFTRQRRSRVIFESEEVVRGACPGHSLAQSTGTASGTHLIFKYTIRKLDRSDALDFWGARAIYGGLGPMEYAPLPIIIISRQT